MRRRLLLASASACLLVTPAFAADAPVAAASSAAVPTRVTTPSTVTPEQAEAALEAARVERAERVELNTRMTAVIEASQKNVMGLQKMIDASTDAKTRRDLELRMAQAKRETTFDLLRVQATFAREKGRIAQAEKIEAEIEEALNPKRVAPAASSQARTDAVAPAGGAR